MHPLSVQVPDIIDRLASPLTSALRPLAGGNEAECIVGELKGLAREISSALPTRKVERTLLKWHGEINAHLTPALAMLSFLISQHFFEREEPASALDWNEQARHTLNGFHPPLAEAAMLSQELGIRLQQNELEVAAGLRKRIETIQLRKDEFSLIDTPLHGFNVIVQYESGEWGDQLQDKLDPLPEFYQRFILGRFYLQYRRENKALEEFRRAEEALGSEESLYPAFPSIIALHRARAYYQQNQLNRALELFTELAARFQMLEMANGRLRAEIGIASIERIRGDYRRSRERFEAVLAEAKSLSLKKAAFHASLGLAALAVERENLDEAREVLSEAEGFLTEKNRKHRCTLNMRRGEVEYGDLKLQEGKRYFEASKKLLSATDQEEAALLRANMIFHEARYMMRVAKVEAARKAIGDCIEELTSRVLNNPESEYRDEAGPAYLVNRLFRLDAFCALKVEQPVSALYSCYRARESTRSDGDRRSFSKLVFWEAVAYALLVELELSIMRLEELGSLRHELGIERPIGQYLYEAATLDDSGFVSKLALSIGHLFRGSSFYERFRQFEPEFAAAAIPSLPVKGEGQRFRLQESERREVLASFENEYERRLLTAEGAPVPPDGELSNFAALYRQMLDKAAREPELKEQDESNLEETGKKVWASLAGAIYQKP